MSDITSPLTHAKLSLFRDSFDSSPIQTVTLTQILNEVRTGRHQSKVETLRQTLAREGKAAYDRAKAYLPAVTFSGVFVPKRGNAYLQQHSGLIWCDLDHLDDIAATKRAICRDPRTVCLFTSPSAIGLKAGIHGPIVADDTSYKHAWNTVREEYEQLYGVQWDPSGKDVSRLCYVSYDPDLYWNPDAICFDVPPIPIPAPKPTAPTRTWREPSTHHDPRDYVARALEIAVELIRSAPMGTRHHTRLRAARLLGGFVGSNLLRYEEALSALSRALEGHTEDMAKALKTVVDGLGYGEAYPITLEALEAERQAWIDQHRSISHHNHPPPPTADPWAGRRTLPLRPYTGLRMPREVRRG